MMTKHIAMISEHASPLTVVGGVDSGGQNVYVAQLAQHLARIGWQVDVFTRRDGPQLPEIVSWMQGVRVVHVAAGPAEFVRKEELLGHMGEFTENMLAFCSAQPFSYDLMHANFWMSGLVAANIKQALGVPFVVTFHALGRVRRRHQKQADEFPDDRFAIEDAVAADADAIIAECPQDAQDLAELYQADLRKVWMIPAGYDPDDFAPIDRAFARRLLGLSQDERIVLQLGRLVPRKGIETVVRGVSRVVRDHKLPVRLLVVGGESDDPDPLVTPEIGRLHEIAREEGIADSVTFTGRRRRRVLKFYYSAADVFATLPWYEPFGMTPLEAMGCATPVIGSRVGGVKFTVVHGQTGYLVPPRDPGELAWHLAHLLKNHRLRSRFGQQGLERARDHFTWENVAGRVADLYEYVIEGGAVGWEIERDRIQSVLPILDEPMS